MPRDEADCIAAVTVGGRLGVPITPRGGATSLSGQTFGTGLVLDVSKYMDQVLEVNVEERWVRVQPGVIRDLLNAQLAAAPAALRSRSGDRQSGHGRRHDRQ